MSYTPVSSNTLLSYALDTLPDPLQASPATGNTVYAALTFSVSNNSSVPISVSQIQFTLPVGTLAQDLTNTPGVVVGNVSPAGVWNISMTSPGVYTAVPASGNPVSVTVSGIIMQLYNIPVNQETGTVSIVVSETASNPTSPSQARTATFDVGKFPYGFFFTNFAPNVGQVADQGSVTLTWEGSDQATYSMSFGGAPVDVTNFRTWTSPPLSNDTTFLLTASVVSQGQTVTKTLGTTVIVSNPEVTAASLVVTGTTSLQGTTTIGGSLNANNGITVGGATALNNTLNVTGASTLSSLTVNQQLQASGGINTAQLTATGITANGNATVNGNTTVNGTLALTNMKAMGAAVGINSVTANWSATYTAQTDGMVCGLIQSPANFSVPSAATAYGSCNNMVVSAQGGSTCVLSTWNNSTNTAWNYNLTGSFTLPVPNGARFSVSAIYPGNTALYPTVFFYWIPFGTGGITQIADVADHPENVPRSLPDIELFTTENTYSHAPAVNRLMDVLSDLFGDKLNAGLKVRLAEAVKALVYEEGKVTVRAVPG